MRTLMFGATWIFQRKTVLLTPLLDTVQRFVVINAQLGWVLLYSTPSYSASTVHGLTVGICHLDA